MKKQSLLALLFALLFSILPLSAEAGKPIYKDENEETNFTSAKVVPSESGQETAYTYYATLGAGKVDTYQIYVQAGQISNLSLTVPQAADLKDFTPTLALVGPGITSTASVTLPVTIPQGSGAITLDYSGSTADRATATDQGSGQAVWAGPSYTTPYPQSGSYYLLVWDRSGRSGKYVLSLGEVEENGLFDIIKFPYTWAKLNLWFGNWLPVLIAGVVSLLIVLGVVALLRRRPATPAAPAAS